MRRFAQLATVLALGSAVAWSQPAAEKARPPKTNPKDGAAMVWVAGGEFVRGSDNGRPNESPARQLDVAGFYMYKTEVTVRQYFRFCAATRHRRPEEPNDGWNDDYPIVNVSWNDAVAYSKWAGVRLPTEAEWEKAARGPAGRIYPWGNDWSPSKLRFSKVFGIAVSPTAVGSYPAGASPYGCLDMAGNVYEWCADWYGPNYYKEAPAHDPPGPATGTLRVFRGGWWYNDIPSSARAAIRGMAVPTDGFKYVGFRCAEGTPPVVPPVAPPKAPATPKVAPTLAPALPPASSTAVSSPAAGTALTALPGEIVLFGNFDPVAGAWNAQTRQFTIAVTRFQLPSGKAKDMAAAKDKVIVVGPNTTVHKQGTTEVMALDTALAAKGKMAVIGTDAGTGQPLQARDIVLLP